MKSEGLSNDVNNLKFLMTSENVVLFIKRNLVIISAVLVVLLFVCVLILFSFVKKTSSPATPPPSSSNTVLPTGSTVSGESQIPIEKPQSLSLPQFQAERHVLAVKPPTVPSTVSTYGLKTNYTTEEVSAFGARLGLRNITTSKENPNFYVVFEMDDMNNRGYMEFNKQTGEFMYKSFGAVMPMPPLNSPESASLNNPMAIGLGYVKQLGMDDGTVTCTNSYYVKGFENTMVTVVCHRDWAKVGGIPIVSFPGIINVDENTPLSSLTLGKADANAPQDPNIVQTSNGTDAKVQPNDFNSISFTLERETGQLIAITSSLRQIVQTQTLDSKSLLDPIAAFQKVQQNYPELTLLIPAGQGSVDWNAVYTKNTAQAKQAMVKDFIVAYLEKPSFLTQSALVPYYIFRGTAQLDSGYTTRFLSLVPAIQGKTIVDKSLKTTLQALGQVAGVQTTLIPTKYSGQKQGTFKVDAPTDVARPIPTGQLNGSECFDMSSNTLKDSTVTLHIDGLGDVNLAYNGQHMYYIGKSAFPVTDKEVIEDAFFNLVAKQYVLLSANYINKNKSPQFNSLMQTHTTDSINQLFDSKGKSCSSDIFPPSKYCTSAGIGYIGYDHTRIAAVRDMVVAAFVDKPAQTAITELAVGSDYFPQSTLKDFSKVFANAKNTENGAGSSRCYISGVSPSLFLYPQKKSNLTVTFPSTTTYTYPGATKNTLTVSASSNGLLTQANNTYNYLYYEYSQAVSFTTPKTGYLVETKTVDDWIHTVLAKQAGLNNQETKQIITEVTNALRNVNSEYIKISFANEQELDTKLPLTFTPSFTTVNRLHLLITPMSVQQDLMPQTYPTIQRHGSYAVELGARLVE